MWNFKRDIYKQENELQVVVLQPFDYIIVTFQYTPPIGQDYDLDTITTFRYPSSVLSGTTLDNTIGFIPGTGVVGCGATSGANVPSGSNYTNGYLFWGGDDVNQTVSGTFGESVVISFKNLEISGITTSPDIIADLYAGWHSRTNVNNVTDPYPINIKYETFIGGVISKEIVGAVVTNRFVSTGTPVSPPQVSNLTQIISGKCGQGVDIKRKVASISFNLFTKVANVTFY